MWILFPVLLGTVNAMENKNEQSGAASVLRRGTFLEKVQAPLPMNSLVYVQMKVKHTSYSRPWETTESGLIGAPGVAFQPGAQWSSAGSCNGTMLLLPLFYPDVETEVEVSHPLIVRKVPGRVVGRVYHRQVMLACVTDAELQKNVKALAPGAWGSAEGQVISIDSDLAPFHTEGLTFNYNDLLKVPSSAGLNGELILCHRLAPTPQIKRGFFVQGEALIGYILGGCLVQTNFGTKVPALASLNQQESAESPSAPTQLLSNLLQRRSHWQMPNYAFDEEDGSDEKDVVNDRAKTLGMTWMPVENKMLQKFLGVEQGVVVANPSKLGGAYKVLYRGDVVTHIDGCNIAPDGSVIAGGRRMRISEYLFTRQPCSQEQKGTDTAVAITYRAWGGQSLGAPQNVNVELKERDPLLKPYFDTDPPYVIVGGLIFTRASLTLFDDLSDEPVLIPAAVRKRVLDRWKKAPDEEIVLYVGAMQNPANIFYKTHLVQILDKINGEKVTKLEDVVTLTNKIYEGFVAEANAAQKATQKNASAALLELQDSGGAAPCALPSIQSKDCKFMEIYFAPLRRTAEPFSSGGTGVALELWSDEGQGYQRVQDPIPDFVIMTEAAIMTTQMTLARNKVPSSVSKEFCNTAKFPNDPMSMMWCQQALHQDKPNHKRSQTKAVPLADALAQLSRGARKEAGADGSSFLQAEQDLSAPPSPPAPLMADPLLDPFHIRWNGSEGDDGLARELIERRESLLQRTDISEEDAEQTRGKPPKGGKPPKPPKGAAKKARTLKSAASRGKSGSADRVPLDRVVKIYCMGSKPVYSRPWLMSREFEDTGSGIVFTAEDVAKYMDVLHQGQGIGVDSSIVLTNAHVVESGMQYFVQRMDHPDKYPAMVLAIGRDVDMAILKVMTKEEVFTDLSPLRKSPHLPQVRDTVLVAGFPRQGQAASITSGIVSRVTAFGYAFDMPGGLSVSPPNFVIQVDAAINPGNSGGPVFTQDGLLAGLAFASLGGSEGMGYVIPEPLIELALPKLLAQGMAKLAKANKKMDGTFVIEDTTYAALVPESGFSWGPIENPSLKAYLGLVDPNQKEEEMFGVMVTSVSPLSVVKGHLQHGDIVTHVDGFQISPIGEIVITQKALGLGTEGFNDPSKDLRVKFEVMISSHMSPARKTGATEKKSIGQLMSGRDTTLRVCRKKDKLPKNDGDNPKETSALICVDKTFQFKPLPALSPRYDGFDAKPHYFIIGGLVWTEMSIPLFLEKAKAKVDWPTATLNNAVHNWKLDDPTAGSDDHKLVVLLDVLTDDANTYLNLQPLGILWHVNNKPIRSIRQMIKVVAGVVKQGAEKDFENFITFGMGGLKNGKPTCDWADRRPGGASAFVQGYEEDGSDEMDEAAGAAADDGTDERAPPDDEDADDNGTYENSEDGLAKCNPRVPDAAIPVKVLLGSAPLLRKFGVPGVAGGSPLPPLPPSTKKKELPPELAKAQKAVEEAEVTGCCSPLTDAPDLGEEFCNAIERPVIEKIMKNDLFKDSLQYNCPKLVAEIQRGLMEEMIKEGIIKPPVARQEQGKNPSFVMT